MNKFRLKKELANIGIVVVKGNFVKKSDIKKIIAESGFKEGIVKWFRKDGTGYIVEKNKPESIYFDSSSIKGDETSLEKGQKVRFIDETLMGRKVAVEVHPVVSSKILAETPDLKQETNDQFFTNVMSKLTNWVKRNESVIRKWNEENDYTYYEGVDALKSKSIRYQIDDMRKMGWSVEDVVAYFLLTEDIDPRIPEDTALRKMGKIGNKYKVNPVVSSKILAETPDNFGKRIQKAYEILEKDPQYKKIMTDLKLNADKYFNKFSKQPDSFVEEGEKIERGLVEKATHHMEELKIKTKNGMPYFSGNLI